MASQLFPLAAQADDKLSRVVSELQALVQVRDEGYADLDAFYAPLECRNGYRSGLQARGMAVLGKYKMSQQELYDRLSATISEKWAFYFLQFNDLLPDMDDAKVSRKVYLFTRNVDFERWTVEPFARFTCEVEAGTPFMISWRPTYGANPLVDLQVLRGGRWAAFQLPYRELIAVTNYLQ